MRLTLGDYVEGFAEYEWRWKCRDFVRPDFTQPVWTGESIAGKTILLIAEQGLGDAIQFVRFAPKVKAEGATVVFRCPTPLLRLLANFPGIDVLIPEGEPLPSFDTYVPLLSLPAIFRTKLEDIPGIHPVPYLRADQEVARLWSDRLGPRSPGELRVGICWQGNAAHPGDRFRSAPLAAFLPLATVPGVTLISIQKGYGIEQIAPLADRLPVLDFRDSTRFEDTAALMALLDLMITIDSAPVHLAGALGVPTWLAASTDTDWRWLADREDSPWYPTVRIFRQSELYNWDSVFERMARELSELAASPGHELKLSNWHSEMSQSPRTSAPGQNQKNATSRQPFRAAQPPPSISTPSKTKTTFSVPLAGYNRPSLLQFNRQRQCRHGMMLYNINDSFIGRSLDLYGEFSEGEINLFEQVVKPGQVILEVGANIGAHTVWMAQAVGRKGMVLAFEPQRIVYQTLCANLALNSIVNVNAFRAAVGKVAGTIVVPWLDPLHTNNFGGLELGRHGEGEMTPVMTIDGLNLSACHFIKIDVEGMEREVLEGAVQAIAAFSPIIYVENDRKEKSESLVRFIDGLGYNMYWHTPLLYNPNNFSGNTENVFNQIASINMICVPKIYPQNVTGLRPVQVPAIGIDA